MNRGAKFQSLRSAARACRLPDRMDFTESLTTYLLQDLTRFEVELIKAGSPPFFRASRAGYGVLLSDVDPAVSAGHIARKLPGDNVDLVGGWLDKRKLRSLFADYQKSSPTKEERAVAVTRWRDFYNRRLEIGLELTRLSSERRVFLEELETVKVEERQAVEEVVRTHGNLESGLSIDGELWEIHVRGGHLYFRKANR